MSNTQNKIPKLRFPEFDGEWVKLKLDEVSDKIQDGTHFSPVLLDFGNYKYVTSKNIRNGQLDLSDISYLSDDAHREIYKRCDVRLNDILLTKDGSATGTVCLNTLDEEFSLLSSVAFIRGNPKKASNQFIYQCIAGPMGQREILSSVAGQAITRITLTKLRNFQFFYPSLPEQHKIATFLTSIDARIQLLERKKAQLETYKKGVMQQLFSQRLRFKQEDGSEFPEWEEKRLGEVCYIVKGQQLNKEELSETGAYPCQNGGVEPSGYTTEFNTVENTITISEGGNSCGYINFMTTKFWCGGHCYALQLLSSDVLNVFLYQFLKNKQSEIMRLRVGSGLPNIQKGDIQKFLVSIPSLPEQRKIASFLGSLDAQIEAVGAQIGESKEFKRGLLQNMFV